MIRISRADRIDVETLDWGAYWRDCQSFAPEIELLHQAWVDLIVGRYRPARFDRYVWAYFTLLKTCTARIVQGKADLHLLRKVIGFETFVILDDREHSVAGTFNTRNPAYLLSKIAQPKVFDDPKLLPLICPVGTREEGAALYHHYRRISLANASSTQLFVYPAVSPCRQSAAHSLIGRLFRCLTRTDDPWIRKRSEVLFDSVFDRLVDNCPTDQIQLLDMACGSARLTIELCKRASDLRKKAFDLTLVDVVRRSKSLPQVFYQNPSTFHSLVFRRESLFDWMDKHSDSALPRFDIVLMLRVLDLFSRFDIEKLNRYEIAMLVRRDRESIVFGADVLSPAELIELGMQNRIQHTTKRTRLRRGSMFYQLSLSDYFKAIHMTMGGEVDNDADTAYVPIRRFNGETLVLSSGRSLIAQLARMSDRIIIEDVDLTAKQVREHIDEFGIVGVRAVDMTDRQRVRGASVTLIDKKG